MADTGDVLHPARWSVGQPREVRTLLALVAALVGPVGTPRAIEVLAVDVLHRVPGACTFGSRMPARLGATSEVLFPRLTRAHEHARPRRHLG